jgi:hypothetical protein
MLETPLTNIETPAAANLNPLRSVLNYGEFALELVTQPNLDHLDPPEQGVVIVDQFVGDIAAGNGVLTSSMEFRGPTEVLLDVEYGVSEALKGGAWEKTLLVHTKNNGLRQAVDTLARDDRVFPHLSKIAERIKQDPDGMTLRSPIQIYSYIDGIARRSENPAEANKWATTLKETVWAYANSGPGYVSRPWGRPSQETTGQTQRRKDYVLAIEEARRTNIDPSLLERSAELWHDQVLQKLSDD